MARDPRLIAGETANGVGIGHEVQQQGMILCELRGQNPWELINAGGFTMQRWQAAIAELRIIADVLSP